MKHIQINVLTFAEETDYLVMHCRWTHEFESNLQVMLKTWTH